MPGRLEPGEEAPFRGQHLIADMTRTQDKGSSEAAPGVAAIYLFLFENFGRRSRIRTYDPLIKSPPVFVLFQIVSFQICKTSANTFQ